jgi:hypothetical protein
VTGGYVYRGSNFPGLAGVYLYADFCRGRLWGMAKDAGNQWFHVQIQDTGYTISSFGEDEQGELYITDYGSGSVLRLVKAPVLTANVDSQAARDGFIIETSENSSRGGFTNSAAGMIRMGDQLKNQQVLGILSFSTSGLPDSAVILSAKLSFRKASILGTDPFTILSPLQADIRSGYFGQTPELEASDFQAAANRLRIAGVVVPLPGSFYSLPIGRGIPSINKTGLTQLRLYFTVADNNNLSADLINIYSDENATPGSRPRLTIKYYLP